MNLEKKNQINIKLTDTLFTLFLLNILINIYFNTETYFNKHYFLNHFYNIYSANRFCYALNETVLFDVSI